jgi:exodeoxyribonuclease VII large subunit
VRAAIEARGRRRRGLEERLRRFDVRPRLSAGRRRLEAARMTLEQSLALRLARQRGALDRLSAKLSQLSPLLILERGYAIVSGKSGIVKQTEDAPAGSRIHVRVAKGEFDATVKRK